MKKCNGRINKTANSSKVVVISGLKEVLVNNISYYENALKDVNRYVEFEVELEVIEDGFYFSYEIIPPDNIFEDVNT